MAKRGLLVVIALMLACGLVCTVACSKKAVKTDQGAAVSQTGAKEASGPAGKTPEQLEEEAIRMEMQRAQQAFENEDVTFDYDKADLTSAARAILERKAAWLQHNPNTNAAIEGHCDERGTVEYNIALGERRAKAAMNYLVDLGIKASRLSTVSYGKERPLDPGHDEAAWAKNRRAHFVVK